MSALKRYDLFIGDREFEDEEAVIEEVEDDLGYWVKYEDVRRYLYLAEREEAEDK
jgi:hypothetical protein